MFGGGVGIAAFLGDQLLFLLGRHYGRPYLDRRSSGWVQRSIRRAEKFSTDLGWWAVVVGRFIPWGRVCEPPTPKSCLGGETARSPEGEGPLAQHVRQ